MGSFANSLHVKTSDTERVATNLTELFAEAGWQPTQKKLELHETWGGEGPVRGVQISAPREGWVSILDTDLMGVHAAVPRLAKKLGTHAIFFLVDDSDAWSYLLADPKGVVSEFESGVGAGDEEDYDDSEMVESGAAIAQLQNLMRDGSMLQKFQDMQAQMLAAAPPEVREAEVRIKHGQGTTADMQVYQAWTMKEMPKHQAQLRSAISGLFNLPRIVPETRARQKAGRKQTKAERAVEKKRLDSLRPLFGAGASDEQVQEVLNKQATFAEDVLAEFLLLLDISEFYANLSYRYLRGAKDSELAAHNIQFVHDLRFETNRPRQFSSF
jgi:hypothetical protein